MQRTRRGCTRARSASFSHGESAIPEELRHSRHTRRPSGGPLARTVANRRRGRRSPERLLILRSVARDEGERIIAARGSGLPSPPAELAPRERRLLAPGREFDDSAVEAAVASPPPVLPLPLPFHSSDARSRHSPARSADPRRRSIPPPDGHTKPPALPLSRSLDGRVSVLSYPSGDNLPPSPRLPTRAQHTRSRTEHTLAKNDDGPARTQSFPLACLFCLVPDRISVAG